MIANHEGALRSASRPHFANSDTNEADGKGNLSFGDYYKIRVANAQLVANDLIHTPVKKNVAKATYLQSKATIEASCPKTHSCRNRLKATARALSICTIVAALIATSVAILPANDEAIVPPCDARGGGVHSSA